MAKGKKSTESSPERKESRVRDSEGWTEREETSEKQVRDATDIEFEIGKEIIARNKERERSTRENAG